ncbi:MAG TPA: ComEC/Rec2 family competence protein, partial [Ktedonobacteraceae bacterium]
PLFNVTGVAHLIAPSGFKVTLLAGVIGAATHWITPELKAQKQRLLPAERHKSNWRRWLHTLLLVLCIAIYTILSGAGPAAIRAGVMGTLLVLAPRLGRFYNVYTAMAVTALLMSALDPFVIWDSGFELSFVGTLGILLFTPFLQHRLRFLSHLPLGSHVAELVAVTLAAQTATLPIFALSFNQISFVAPLANLASVPLLGVLLVLSTLICLGGLIVPPLTPVLGWLAWPLLWYMTTVISWCARLPGAYLQVNALSPLVAWTYYALLAWLTALLLSRWQPPSNNQHQRSPMLSRRAKLVIQGVLALVMLLSTGVLAQVAPSNQRLAITLLSTSEPAQGQALLLSTPDGQTALIDEGANSAVLAQTLDTYLPFWQRSLNLLILSNTGPDNLAGVQDIVTRYQVQIVVDAGMLHPSLAYARWRNTLATHHLTYMQVHQGARIDLNPQVVFQVLWPLARLHKSSNEIHDNALVLRLLTPGSRLLLLNTAALSGYALQMLASSLAPSSLQAEAVQAASETSKAFPAELSNVLILAHPSLLLLTSMHARQHKSTARTAAQNVSTAPPDGPWEVLNGSQTGPLKLLSNGYRWEINLPG